MQNVAQYIRQARMHTRKVFFTGSTALKKGQGVTYAIDTGTATDADERRDKYVEVPVDDSYVRFAGTCIKAYNAVTGGQVIEIAEPGGFGYICPGVPTTSGTTVLSFGKDAGATGLFYRAGLAGRGTALALQTTTGLASAASFDGSATVSSTVITKTGAGANVSAGDFCYVVGGASNTIGKYTVASSTSGTITLTAAPGGSGKIAFFVISDTDPVCLAYLYDGPESGGVEHCTPADNTETAPDCSACGMTYIVGTVTLGTGATVATLDNGVVPGQRKGFVLNGALTTNGAAITSAAMLKPTFATTATITLAADADSALLEWNSGVSKWLALGGDGTLA